MMYVAGFPDSKSPYTTLLDQIPEWQKELAKLSETMDDRQLEVAALPVWRRLKQNGSCETLRSKEDPGLGPTPDSEDKDVNMVNGTTTIGAGEKAPPRLLRNSTSPAPIRNHSGRRLAAAGVSKPGLRKRKTESISSMVSAERKKSEVPVYYDSRVQTAFTEMCNSMAKTRNLLWKMKNSRRDREMNSSYGSAARSSVLDKHRYRIQALAGELSAAKTNGVSGGSDFNANMELEADTLLPDLEADPWAKSPGTKTPALDADMELEVDDDLLPDLEADLTPDTPAAAKDAADGLPGLSLEADDNLTPDDALPPLNYRSTRLMNNALTSKPYSRALLARHDGGGALATARYDRYSTSRISSFSSKKEDEPKDVFDDLDAFLEKASKICEVAAHEFLKIGSCRVEIRKIEEMLKGLRERAERGLVESPDLKEDCKPILPQLPSSRWKMGDLQADDGLGELEADDGLGESEVDDGLGELEVDDGLGELEVDPAHRPVQPTAPTPIPTKTGTDAFAKKEAQFITVIRPDTHMDCSGGLEVDVSSLSMKSADEVVTPLDDSSQQKKLNMDSINTKDLLAKYRLSRSTTAKLMSKTMDVHEVHINPLNRVS